MLTMILIKVGQGAAIVLLTDWKGSATLNWLLISIIVNTCATLLFHINMAAMKKVWTEIFPIQDIWLWGAFNWLKSGCNQIYIL